MSNKRKNRFILVGIILLLVASLSVGFSAFEKQLLIDDINLDVRLERDVRVTGVTAISSFEATPTIEEYNEKKVLPTITFSKANGYAKFKVDITNFGNVFSGLYNITSNTSGITVQLCDSNGNNCTSDFRTKINGTLGTSKEIGLYIKSTTAGTKNIDLDFDFEP